MLYGIGIEADEERAYLALLRSPAPDARELADRLGIEQSLMIAVLTGLAAKGLLQTSSGPIQAAPPGEALGLLALQRLQEIREAQQHITALADRHPGNGTHEVIEVVRGRAAIAARLEAMQRSARQEVLSVVRPPVAAGSNGDGEHTPAIGHRREPGVHHRMVLDRAMLEPGREQTPRLLHQWAGSDDDVRVTTKVPIEAVIIDRRLAAMVPAGQHAEEPHALVVRSRPLVECFCWAFESLWDRGVPLPETIGTMADGPLSSADQRVLAFLLAGHTDGAIANQMKVSLRTVQRKVQRLQQLAGVQSRIQLGWQAARRNWL